MSDRAIRMWQAALLLALCGCQGDAGIASQSNLKGAINRIGVAGAPPCHLLSRPHSMLAHHILASPSACKALSFTGVTRDWVPAAMPLLPLVHMQHSVDQRLPQQDGQGLHAQQWQRGQCRVHRLRRPVWHLMGRLFLDPGGLPAPAGYQVIAPLLRRPICVWLLIVTEKSHMDAAWSST